MNTSSARSLLSLFLLLGVALGALASESALYKIHHRVHSLEFSLRATVTLRNKDGVLKAFYESVKDRGTISLVPDSEEGYYQVALEYPLGTPSENWPLVSAKACHLSPRTSDVLTLVADGNGIVSRLNYHILNIPQDGSCPSVRPSIPPTFNTTVHIKHPNPVPTPILRPLPAISPDGRPVQPPPEKSFLQKYWIYILPLFIILLITPEDEPPPKK
ncbi:uncharacterized protein EI90DRAFT_3033476 [Cantharellus anzutake]|uniref:uncharacterized protein n=1 Tax=Cantharellus anzutake TaxID=1750568 RepID=UPI00190701F4|nr:uncharacterized protein EI90DRAFT_3033476 [Cantharellus anzutake]KAF8341307.1 hypothetical protein EI90DRAFT_3033476 [Cantharellus anzutake]